MDTSKNEHLKSAQGFNAKVTLEVCDPQFLTLTGVSVTNSPSVVVSDSQAQDGHHILS
jgi:hypothetical protein